MKMQKVRLIDREKFRENIKKIREEKEKNPDKTPNKTLNLPKKRESCGE